MEKKCTIMTKLNHKLSKNKDHKKKRLGNVHNASIY